MPTWPRTLRQAAITDPALHAAYIRQSKLVRRFKPEEYLTVRLLLPARLHPPVIAAVAFMHETDTRIDSGTTDARTTALGEWATSTRQALAGGPVTDATLTVLRDAVSRHPQLAPRTEAFLQAAHHEVNYSGFATEDDLQSYVEGYSLPAFMLLACLLEGEPSTDAHVFERGCRDLIEAMQRVDFLDDLAEDAAHGKVGIPREELDRHGLRVADLLEPTDVVRARLGDLVQEQADLARQRLSASEYLERVVSRQARPFMTAMLQVQKLRLSAVSKKGGRLSDGGARPSLPSVLGVLARQYGAARRLR